MIEPLLDGLGWAFIAVGGLFILSGAIGLVRFPDFYTRLHAAGVTDTLGVELILLGLATQTDSWLVIAKLGFIAVFMFFTSPVSTHAAAHAAYVAKLKPLEGLYRSADASRQTGAER